MAQHRARRIARRGQHETGEVVRQVRRHRLVAVLGARLDAHRHEVERAQDLAVGGIARVAHADPVAGVEQRREGEQESARRARRDHHPGRVEIDAIGLAVVPGDPGPQRRQAEGDGVAERVGFHCPRDGLPRAGRRRRAGLSDLHVDDVPARFLGGARGLHHVHHDERLHLRSPRYPHDAFASLPVRPVPFCAARLRHRAAAAPAAPAAPRFREKV